MELSTEDKERIEQEAEKYSAKINHHYACAEYCSLDYKAGAEYATRYEREQQAKRLESLGNYATDKWGETISLEQQISKLEAERSEVEKELQESVFSRESLGVELERQSEQILKLEGLLHKILKESVGGNVPFSFELYNEIKAALKL